MPSGLRQSVQHTSRQVKILWSGGGPWKIITVLIIIIGITIIIIGITITIIGITIITIGITMASITSCYHCYHYEPLIVVVLAQL